MRLFVVAFVFALMVLPTFGLTLKRIEYNPASERLVAEIENESRSTFNGINVVFYSDGSSVGSFTRENLSITPQSTITAYVDYTSDGKNHEFSAEVFGEKETGEQTQFSEKTAAVVNDDGEKPAQQGLAEPVYLGLIIIMALFALFFFAFVVLKKKVFSGESQ